MATTTETTLTDEQAKWLEDARSLLDFLEMNPDLWGVWSSIDVYNPIWASDHDDVLAFMGQVARRMAPCEKDAGENTQGDFHLTKQFGKHSVVVYTRRENVCSKRVVGTEVQEVEGYSDEDQAAIDALPKVKKLVQVEKVEWECPSLLSAG